MSSTSTETILRTATMADVPSICRIVNHWAAEGAMLPRREEELARTIRDFSVVERDQHVVAVGALAIYGLDLAEVRSLAVDPRFKTAGCGRRIVEFLLGEAHRIGIPRVFAFTYVQGFFEKLGFHVVPPDALPQKAWRDCIHCPKRTRCDEIAVLFTHDDLIESPTLPNTP